MAAKVPCALLLSRNKAKVMAPIARDSCCKRRTSHRQIKRHTRNVATKPRQGALVIVHTSLSDSFTGRRFYCPSSRLAP